MFYRALRPLLFALDPEKAHEHTLEILANVTYLPGMAPRAALTHSRLKTTVAGLNFPNPLGLAAGCDKNGKAVPLWSRFGFGYVEIGTVTGQPQPGNPRPRVFRYPRQDALINGLGFNSEGSAVVAGRVARLRRSRLLPYPLGINIGKTKAASGDEATLEDYRLSFCRLAPLADFIVVNVSSPNTPGLRQWQEKEKLGSLLEMLMKEAADRQAEAAPPETQRLPADAQRTIAVSPLLSDSTRHEPSGTQSSLPIFVKVSPDMADADMDNVVEVVMDAGMSGIIATNTTLARHGAFVGVEQMGGLSGKPLRDRANAVLRYLYRRTEGQIPLVGVGGISTAEDAYERFRSGASLIQCYTAFIYEGPSLPRRINEGLVRLMERDGVKNIRDIVGTSA